MARVASCPQCEHDLLVPDSAEPSALVKCPECRAFFELQHAESRELPAALVVQSHPSPSSAEDNPASLQTVDDFSSRATVKGDLDMVTEEELKAAAGESETIDFTTEDFAAHHGVTPLHAFSGIDETHEFKPAGTETHEEAAQRIDQWFRSAKTLDDVPALPETGIAGESSHELLEPTTHASGGATIDMSGDDMTFGESDSNFELETPSDSPDAAAPWDDSQHMDRLLADIEGQPVDTYEPDNLEAPAHEEQEHFQPAGEWTPDESLAIPAAPGKPERKRSIVRTLVLSGVGGIFGLALGYYALLWLGPVLHRGKDIDFLQVSQYLPKSILPPAFRTEGKKPSALPPSTMANDLAASEKVVKPEEKKVDEPVAPPVSTDATAQKSPAPPEKQAVYTEPVAPPAKKPADTDDRYAIPPAKNEPAMREPAPLDTPPAKAITENAPKVEPVRVVNAPSFTADVVTKSLEAADAAVAGLVKGNLQDGGEVARTKGGSYMAITDFAQKATFADAPDAAKAQQQADDFFRKLLSDAHTRDEVAQIAPRWLSHPKRAQNGVFFAGNAKHVDVLGSVVEYTVELNGGPSVVVVVPVTDPKESISGPKGPIAVFGSIVDKPTSDVPGYTGKAPQVVYAKKLLPLE